MTDEPLLSIRGLKKHYPVTFGLLRREVGRVRAVDGIDIDLHRGEILGLIGESGCGKSTTATTTLRLEEPTAGEITFDGETVTAYDRKELKQFRRRAQMIFQDPTSSFDPRQSVGVSVAEPLRIHGLRDADRRRELAEALLERVGLSAGDYDRYPHELSGGQKQRAALARALVLRPDLLVADEPVSALDVSVQAEILALFRDLREAFELSVLVITHDMSVVRELCDRVAVMYLGEIVEVGPTETLFDDPQHPYTQALVDAVPTPDPSRSGESVQLTGDVPDPANPPSGCRFHPRCPAVIPPDEYDIEQTVWRGLLNLRTDLVGGEFDFGAIHEQQTEPVPTDGGEPTVAERRTSVRTAYDLPDELADAEAERVLSTALDDLLADDVQDAADRLQRAFGTVCVQHQPTMYETEAGHSAACHLHSHGGEENHSR